MTLEELIQTASSLVSSGRQNTAISLYDEWLKTYPTSPYRHVALFNLASLYSDGNQPTQAESLLRNAIAIAPFFSQAYFNLGMICERNGQKDEALSLWAKILDSVDKSKEDGKDMAVAALNQIGRVQETLKRYPEAEAALTQSLLLEPNQPDALQHWVHLRQKQCKWPVYEEFGLVREYDMFTATSPLAMLALFDDPVKQLLSAQAFNRRKFNFKASKKRQATYGHSKLRIGYVSGDLCTHAVGLLLPNFLECHDKTKVELFAYDYSPEDGSPTRQRLKKCFDVFTDIRQMRDSDVSKLVRNHEIDVLIDMHGLSSGARPEIFIDRPAPIQCTWLGFIGTTDFDWIDYMIADKTAVPPEMEKYFSERIIRLNGSLLPRHSISNSFEDDDNYENKFSKVRFANFNNIYKINLDILLAWIKIINETPHAEFWLLDDNPTATNNLRRIIDQNSERPESFIFLPRCLYGEYRDRLKQVDIYLDTYPYNAGSTAGDVLASGTPFLTLTGKTMVSRMGASLLTELGLDNLITYSLDEYTEAAIRLARNPNNLHNLKAMVRAFLKKMSSEPKARAASLEDQLIEILRLKKTTEVLP